MNNQDPTNDTSKSLVAKAITIATGAVTSYRDWWKSKTSFKGKAYVVAVTWGCIAVTVKSCTYVTGYHVNEATAEDWSRKTTSAEVVQTAVASSPVAVPISVGSKLSVTEFDRVVSPDAEGNLNAVCTYAKLGQIGQLYADFYYEDISVDATMPILMADVWGEIKKNAPEGVTVDQSKKAEALRLAEESIMLTVGNKNNPEGLASLYEENGIKYRNDMRGLLEAYIDPNGTQGTCSYLLYEMDEDLLDMRDGLAEMNVGLSQLTGQSADIDYTVGYMETMQWQADEVGGISEERAAALGIYEREEKRNLRTVKGEVGYPITNVTLHPFRKNVVAHVFFAIATDSEGVSTLRFNTGEGKSVIMEFPQGHKYKLSALDRHTAPTDPYEMPFK